MFESSPQILRISDVFRDNAHYKEAKPYFDLSIEVINNFQLSLRDAPRVTDFGADDRALFIALIALLKSSLHNLMGSVLLCNEGLVLQATVLSRSIYERLLTMRYILSEDSPARGQQFLESECLFNKTIINWMKDSQTPRQFHLKKVLEQEREIEGEYRHFMQKYFPNRKKMPSAWHGMTMSDFFAKVSKPRPHEHAYKMFSAPVHSDLSAIRLHRATLEQAGAHGSMIYHVMPGELRSTVRIPVSVFIEAWLEYAAVYQQSAKVIIDVLNQNLLQLCLSDMSEDKQ